MKFNVTCLAIFAVCLGGASLSNAQLPPGQSHIEMLATQANETAAALGEKVDQVSNGGANFFNFGTMDARLLTTLGNLSPTVPVNSTMDARLPTTLGNLSATAVPVSNPIEPADFISRLAGNTQSEERVAWCGGNALVGFNDSGTFVAAILGRVGSPSFSFSFNAWSRSKDAGGSFENKGFLIADPLPSGSIFLDLMGDPVLGCSSSTTFYYASLATDTRTTPPFTFSAISVSKSVDGGDTFGGARIAVELPASTNFLDKPWMAVDGDNLHVTYTHFFVGAPCPTGVQGSMIEYVRSVDGGINWFPPIPISPPACGTPFVQGSQVAVGPAGRNLVYVAWENFPAGFGTGRSIRLKTSMTGGASFPPPGTFETVSAVTAVGDGRQVQGLFRTFIDLQGLAVDRSSQPTSGNVYITWHDGRRLFQADPFASPGCIGAGTYCFGDVLLSRSTNMGLSWSPPFQVNDNNPSSLTDHLFPGLAVDNTGGVRVVFYDRRNDPRNFLIDTFVATCPGGLLPCTNTKVTPNSFPSIHAQDLVVNPAYMGDYLGIAADKLAPAGGVIGAWGDNSLGDPNVASAKQIP